MGNKSFSRLGASQNIDTLLSLNDRRHPQNWLLTYIDVFVLIIMLVVTLVALSNFDTDQKSQTKQPIKKIYKTPTPPQPIKTEITEPKVSAPELPKMESEHPPEQQPKTEPVPALTESDQATEQIEEKPAGSEYPEEKIIEIGKQVEPIEPETPPNNEETIKQDLDKQLEQLGLSDSITMTVTQGYAQLEIQDNILYLSSEANLTEKGRSVLTKLTPLLQQAKGLIYIEGHTDNRPIKTAQFPSNWELGAARATSVLHFLASQQIDAGRMRAVTYADTKPIADNNSAQGRQKNRRVNIVIKVSDRVD